MKEFHPLRFPVGLAKAIINQRVIVLKYETNRVIKAFDMFTCLKSTNICGVISDYAQQLAELLTICKISRTSFYTRLKDCIELKLVTRRGDDLQLTSWGKACELFDTVDTGLFHNINYDLNDKKQTAQHIIAAIAFKEQRENIQNQVSKKLTANPDINIAYNLFMKHIKQSDTAFSPVALFNAQRITYAEGAPPSIYEALHRINPDPNITVKSIQKQFGMKSHRSATYLKRNLAKRDLIKIEKRNSSSLCYVQKVEPAEQIADIMMAALLLALKDGTKAVRAKKNEYCHVWYDNEKNTRTWHLTDALTINPKTFN